MKHTSQKKYDIVIIGGGMIGAAAALALAQSGWLVAVIEHQELQTFKVGDPPDLRISSISYTSVNLLKQLGVWPTGTVAHTAPYRRLEAWEWKSSRLIFDADSLGLSELGFMIENRILKFALRQNLMQCDSLEFYCPARIQSLYRLDEVWRLILDSAENLEARLILGTDGAHSQVRRLAAIGSDGWESRKSCMLITVNTELPQQDVTWQQFFPSGARAFLPLCDQWASLVWYERTERIRQLQSMPLFMLENEIALAFPERLGKVKACATGSFQISRRHAHRYVLPGLVLLGDAAHTINPLVGQGVNLGYRDVYVLLQVLNEAREQGEDWSAESTLMRYQRQRRYDNLMMQGMTDLIDGIFSNNLMPLSLARNLALMGIQRSAALKTQILRYAIGL